MHGNLKNKMITVGFILTLVVVMLGTIMTPPRTVSASERRRLAAPPAFTIDRLFNGTFFADSETYLLDQMIWRDGFRGIKALMVHHLLRQKDNNGLYLIDGRIGKLEYPLRPESVVRAATGFNALYQRYFAGQPAWLAVIPDKNDYLAAPNGYPFVAYQDIMQLLELELESISLLSLYEHLNADDYYRTDIHWRQEKLLPLADLLLQTLGRTEKVSDRSYQHQQLYPFRGSYYGQAALPLEPDELVYLIDDQSRKPQVYDHEKGSWLSVYEPDLFKGMDPYDVFLGGARALITIENESAASERELIIFRDSFASSLAPLLLPGYARITLVDLRYMRADLLPDYLTFHEQQDVLFLYSTQVLNNSAMLRFS